MEESKKNSDSEYYEKKVIERDFEFSKDYFREFKETFKYNLNQIINLLNLRKIRDLFKHLNNKYGILKMIGIIFLYLFLISIPIFLFTFIISFSENIQILPLFFVLYLILFGFIFDTFSHISVLSYIDDLPFLKRFYIKTILAFISFIGFVFLLSFLYGLGVGILNWLLDGGGLFVILIVGFIGFKIYDSLSDSGGENYKSSHLNGISKKNNLFENIFGTKEKKEMRRRIKNVKQIFSKFNKSCPALYLERNGHGVTGISCQAGSREVNHSMSIGDFFGGWSIYRYSRYRCFNRKHKKCPFREDLSKRGFNRKYIKNERNEKNNNFRDGIIHSIIKEYNNLK